MKETKEKHDNVIDDLNKLFNKKCDIKYKKNKNNVLFNKKMEDDNPDIVYYLESLRIANDNINKRKKDISLKDVVGFEFEQHRKRLYEYFGYTVDKKRNYAKFNVDWSIYYNGNLVGIEEDKGHYVDSCFLDRSLTSYAKTIHIYIKNGIKCPKFILHSFTKYKLYKDKCENFYKILRDDIKDQMLNNMVYTTVTLTDRIKRNKWYNTKDENNSYIDLYELDLIKEDIRMIRSLSE